MADEYDDTGPDLLRDRLLMQAVRGEITGEQAEEAAAAHGLEPFEKKPELPRLDPKLKSHWSIVMAVAWIAWRDFGLVREQDPDFCSACFHWIYRKWKDPGDYTAEPVERAGYFLETRLAPTVNRLALLDHILRTQGNVPSTAVMTIPQAVAALWQALPKDSLVAQGFDAHGAVVKIPSREWVYLRLREARGRDVLRYDAISQPEPFTAPTLGQSDLLRLWPATGESPASPPTAIDTGGRPAEHDGAAIEGARADEPSHIVGIATKAHRTPLQINRIKEALSLEFTDGPPPPNLTDKEILGRIKPIFEEKSWKLPSIDSIARARGRRKVG
ncbi:hypothetical protein ABIB94_004160 [Bradyrhizobium sp. JR7.2]|uniref:hypothetical protein n=1 Tax=unclassified Bradyrhizobium TaxID=2631580 RepID=UPI00339ABF66